MSIAAAYVRLFECMISCASDYLSHPAAKVPYGEYRMGFHCDKISSQGKEESKQGVKFFEFRPVYVLPLNLLDICSARQIDGIGESSELIYVHRAVI